MVGGECFIIHFVEKIWLFQVAKPTSCALACIKKHTSPNTNRLRLGFYVAKIIK